MSEDWRSVATACASSMPVIAAALIWPRPGNSHKIGEEMFISDVERLFPVHEI